MHRNGFQSAASATTAAITMVARAGRSRFFACLGLLIVMVGFVTMFHNSQQQLDELRQLGLRCEQQQKSVQQQMEVIVDQKLRLENSLESERMINEANRKELKQKAKEEKEEHSKTSMEANIRYASLQQQCNLVKSQLGDLTEECSRSKKQQSEEINSLRLKVSELHGKVQRYKQESANDAEHLKAQIVQLKSDKLNLEATLRRQLGEKDHVIEKMRDLATKMEKENAHYLENCKLPADQLPKQHHRYRDVLEALSRDAAAKANAPVHNFNEQLPVSDDLYRIPVALNARHLATPANHLGASSFPVSIGLSPSTFSPPFATNKRTGGMVMPQASDEQETRVIANPFEVVPRADVKRSERRSVEAVPKTNPTDGVVDAGSPLHPALDGGIINSVENFQIIPKPLPAVAAPEGAPANNVLQEPHLMKTSTSVSTSEKRSSDRNLQLPILAAPTVLPGPSLEHSSKRSNNGGDGGGGTLSGSSSSSSTTSTTTNASVRKAAGAAPNRSVGSATRKPLSNRHTKQVPVGIVPFPDIMPELEQNISENVLDNRYANVAAAAAGSTGGVAETAAGGAASSASKKALADKQRRHGADLNFLNGGGANAADDNGAHEVQDTEMRGKRPALGGLDGERGAENGAVGAADDDQLGMGNENNLNAAEEDTNLYDNANDAAIGLGNKPQFGGQHHLDYNDVMVPGHGGIGRHIGSKRREGPGGGGGGIDSKGVIIDRLGDKLINEIAHDHGKEGDNYPNEMEDLHLVGNEAEEEDESTFIFYRRSRMQQWLKISLLVCTFGFLKEIRPSEPFIVDYLAGPWRNLTMDQIVQEAFPIGTYSYLAQLAVIFLVTDFLRYKPIIIVNGAAGIIVWSMLTWTTSLNALKVLEIFYGTYCAAEVAYFSYIYAKVDREHYQKVTSHTRAAIYSGRFFAASLAQLLVYFEAMDYRQLNYLSLAAQISATLWALFLPSVPTSMYFHRQAPISEGQQQPNSITVPCTVADKQTKMMDALEDDRSDDSKPPPASTDRSSQLSFRSRLKGAFVLLWTHFRVSFTNRSVLQWSIWYALAMAGYIQILAYVQALWSSIDETQPAVWNGAVEAALTLLGAIVSLLAGYLHSGFLKPRTSLLSLALLSFAAGGAMLLATKTGSLIVSYIGYMIFCVLYAFAITVVSAEIAKNISDDCFGLVFGFNTLVALSLQTLLTFSVTDSDGWFALDVFGQFTVFSCYFLVLGGIYTAFLVAEIVGSVIRRSRQ
uniref:Uncharacterized protein n=1 Tax=Anopheles minimus TaxID=112268 RepID=A0A182W031_9DIPT